MLENTQPISQAYYHPAGSLEVFKIFPTIQGEGPLVGMPAVFVRLHGCNLRCPMCDTDYTSRLTVMRPDQIHQEISELMPHPGNSHNSGLVVFTGGEPFRQNLTPVINLLLSKNFIVQVETNGTLPPSPGLPKKAVIVCSPKTKRINRTLAPKLSALKYVIHSAHLDPEDGLPTKALGHPASPTTAKPPGFFETSNIYVQPVDTADPVENARHLEAAIQSSMKHGYRLCLQTHKIINME